MSDVKLGEQPNEGQERDAIHVAVAPYKASEMLRPGQRVGIISEGVAGPCTDVMGIVDPYLTDVVPKGQLFWLCLLPGLVSGMRHHWVVEGISNGLVDGISKEEAKAWLKEQLDPLGVDFDELVYGDHVQGGYTMSYKNEEAQDHWYEIQDDYWKYREIFIGTKVEEGMKGGFSCLC